MITSPATSGDETPSCHDSVTMTCPVCQDPFTPVGRQRYCGDACRAAAYRRRRDAVQPPVVVHKSQLRKPITVYECDGCGARAVGGQRCEECRTFMRRVGIGGACPNCDEPVSIEYLLGPNVTVEAGGGPSRQRRA
jgi:hypothetical protein